MQPLSLPHIAKVLGGEITGPPGRRQVIAPGPGHRPKDRSMAVMINRDGTNVIVTSHAGDDPLVCKDYVREKLGLPKFRPKPRRAGNGSVDDQIFIALTGKLPKGKSYPKIVDTPVDEPAASASTAPSVSPAPAAASGAPKLTDIYPYTELDHTLLYQVLRYFPKDFRQRCPDGNGGWINHGIFADGKTKRVLFRYPETVKAMAEFPDAQVFVCEGEKDALNVVKLGLIATCVAGGVWTGEIAAVLKDRDIIYLEDNDKSGRDKSAATAEALHGVAATLRVVQFADLPPKDDGKARKDVTDWIELDPANNNAEALGKRCLRTPIYDPATKDEPEIGNLPPLTLDQWAARDLPPPDFLLGNWLTTTSRVLLAAPTGIGKTNLGLAIGMRIAAGVEFLHWQGCRAARVLYIDGEMSRRLLKERLAYEEVRLGLSPETFFVLSREDFPNFEALNTPEGQAWLLAFIKKIGGVDLILFDNIMCLLIGNMSDEEPWKQTMPLVWTLTQMKIGQLWLHHTGHDESRSYGTKTREWQMDSVLHLEICEAEAGVDVCFTLTFRKARERTPATRLDFQNVKIWLAGNEWQYDLTEKAPKKKDKVSKTGMKFLKALDNVLASEQAITVAGGRKCAKLDHWQAECVVLTLIDKDEKPDSARAMFSKYRLELITNDLVVCVGDMAWRL
jgi:hypothetical protein